jgi:hypothetical protein
MATRSPERAAILTNSSIISCELISLFLRPRNWIRRREKSRIGVYWPSRRSLEVDAVHRAEPFKFLVINRTDSTSCRYM